APGAYNTHTLPGLPAGPICAPGRAALEAVAHPADSDALYFVADGSGGHAFASSLSDHNRNVGAWRARQAPGR
ncbi:endolytic transglycosylase MltG, partial [Gluconacetobacter sacchari]|uniref:endolytic transglycosylase MltG n=1 Tax=Gluconacetobacter sacchari TaxID=92759 RepID=UPI002231921F